MSLFLRLLSEDDKATALQDVCSQQRAEGSDARVFEVEPEAFDAVPGKPFAYWVSEAVRRKFTLFSPLSSKFFAGKGPDTGDDFQFLRLNWEVDSFHKWINHPKGGAFSRHYSDVHLVINWENEGRSISLCGNMRNPSFMGRPGLTWPRRTNGLSFRAMPQGCIFADKGPATFVANDAPDALLALCALVNSQAFGLLVSVQLARVELAQSFEVGLIQQTPVPDLNANQKATLAVLARRAWSAKRTLDTIEETSHAFVLPATLRTRVGDFAPPAIEAALSLIQSEIDSVAFDLYGFSDADRTAVECEHSAVNVGAVEISGDDEVDDEDKVPPIDHAAGLLSWAVGVAFGRFDWRLATGEHAAPAEPEPFDPLPAKSPGMLPDGAMPFHTHVGILVDDPGHPHDLARLVEEVLTRVDAPVPSDVRRWLQRDFFAFHLQRYSKSRRKAPIYWPLATTSGSYTLWAYYPSSTSQTLYTAINDFIEPKLKQVDADVTALRNKGSARTRDDERQFEALQAFELELIELRDTLLKLAPTYKPDHDDGVQISAAPLWPLFRHKPWQKVLKDTWAKLGKGDYDWSHLAMNYWPERVREKCKTDKSLAIAHGLEDLYVEPEAAPKKTRGRKKTGSEE